MRFMVILKGTPETEKEGPLADPQLLAEMGKFNEELIKAGIVLAKVVLIVRSQTKHRVRLYCGSMNSFAIFETCLTRQGRSDGAVP